MRAALINGIAGVTVIGVKHAHHPWHIAMRQVVARVAREGQGAAGCPVVGTIAGHNLLPPV